MRKQSELLNFMKGGAITAIVLFHLLYEYMAIPGWLGTAVKFGGAGIHIFFLASGFGLTLSQLRRPLTPGRFLKRRFTRVYLPYIAVVLLSAALPFMYSGQDRLAAVLSHVFLYKMFLPEYIISFGAQFWFISTAFQFYLVFPLLEKLRGKRGFLAVCCGISLGWMVFTAATGLHSQRVWGSFFLQYLWEFALGMVLAERFHRDALPELRLPLPAAALVTAGALGVYGLMALRGGALAAFNDVFGAVAICGIFWLAYRVKWLRPALLAAGGISYELYLLHLLVFSACRELFPTCLPGYVWAVPALVLAVLASLLYKKLWERLYKK